jgi:hypothetical protein
VDVWARLLAVAGQDVPLPGDSLVQYGALGAVATLGMWVLYRAWREASERADRGEAEVRRLTDLIINRAVPALTASAAAIEDVTELMREMQHETVRNRNSRKGRTGGEDRPS